MATVRGGKVRPHVQAFADAVVEACDLAHDNPGTYPNHQPAIDRALDIFVPFSEAGRLQGNAVCDFALKNWKRFGLSYVIFRQHINSNDGRGWRLMADRGKPGPDTQDHFDHVHVSFEESVSATPTPPTAPIEEDDMILAVYDKRQWLVTGGLAIHIETPHEVAQLERAGVPRIDGESAWVRKLPKGVAA